MTRSIIAALAILIAAAPITALPQATGITAGAAKVDITPGVDELPQGYLGILDRIHSRPSVIDDGDSIAALISVDAGAIPDEVWRSVTTALESELGIPSDHVLLTATHTHSVPRTTGDAYAERIVESVRLAHERRKPAPIGFG